LQATIEAMSLPQSPYILYSDGKGTIFEDTSLYVTGRSGWDAMPVGADEWIALQTGGNLYELPGRTGIGIVVETGGMRLCEKGWAVAAFIPPAHTGLYMAAYETEKDAPRQMKEQEDMRIEAAKKQYEEYQKSGEAEKGIAAMEAYLKAKNITAEKTGKGVFVLVQEQGTGAQAETGKYVKVKYTGRLIETDSTFDAGVYPFKLGTAAVISGWDEG